MEVKEEAGNDTHAKRVHAMHANLPTVTSREEDRSIEVSAVDANAPSPMDLNVEGNLHVSGQVIATQN